MLTMLTMGVGEGYAGELTAIKEQAVDTPEVFSLLGVIHNKKTKSCRQEKSRGRMAAVGSLNRKKPAAAICPSDFWPRCSRRGEQRTQRKGTLCLLGTGGKTVKKKKKGGLCSGPWQGD